MTDSSAPAQVVSALTPMQQALLDRADSIFASIGSTMSKASDIVSQQVPDIAVQYVAYGRASATVFEIAILGLLAFGVWLFYCVGCRNVFELKDCYQEDPHAVRIASWVIGGILSICSLIATLCCLPNLIMVWFAPKVYLLNEIVELAKSLHQP